MSITKFYLMFLISRRHSSQTLYCKQLELDSYISAFVDQHAKSEVRKLPSYIKDTPDVLRRIQVKNQEWNNPSGDGHYCSISICPT